MTMGLGLDTGGTYTDAVVMELGSDRILCKAKSPTTREDLSIGIRGAMLNIDDRYLKEIGVVSLSSTLATNSIVEGKGARVGLVCIGMEYDGSFPADVSIMVDGSHDLNGRETCALDENAVAAFLESVRGRVDGIAITGYLSIRNSSHEERVREMAESILGVPAVCGHDLSSGLGFNERTATCVMNARLIPLITELMDSVKDVMAELNISAPLMVVRGDGSMMSESEARRRPVETIMSGPSASMIGAMRMTGVENAIIMDMGGTTTDIGIIRNGRPRLDPEGAIIGGVRTRVKAAKISTSGIGGDSRIFINAAENKVVLGSLRVMPICRASEIWPSVRESIRRLSSETPQAYAMRDKDSVILGSEFFRTLRIPEDASDFSSTELRLLEVLKEQPLTVYQIDEVMHIHPLALRMNHLEALGLIQRIGFTPTDVLHASGEYDEFDRESSEIVAGYLSRGLGMTRGEFIERCKDGIRVKLCTELMKELLSEKGISELGKAGVFLIDRAVSGDGKGDFDCLLHVNESIIGIGAPAPSYIPQVGETFGTDVIIDGDSDVGNAVGAISSCVSESVSVVIRPVSFGMDSGFRCFSGYGTMEYADLDTAVEESERLVRIEAVSKAENNGAEDISVSVERNEREFIYGDTGIKCLMEIELTATAAGRPRPFNGDEYVGTSNISSKEV